MKSVVVAISAGLLLLMCGAAQAQTKNAAPSSTAPGTITLLEQRIVGRIQRPLAAVDVARIRPQVTVSELRQPLVDRIDDAATKAPF